MTYEIGKFYDVPCVKALPRFNLGAGLIPIFGPLHSDAEFIKFPAPHWHIDFRFLRKRAWPRMWRVMVSGEKACYNHVAQKDPNWGEPILDHSFGVQTRKMQCKREWPTYPYELAQWLPALESAFAGARLKPGLVCPHKGIPLESCPRDGDVVTCPGHGLRWNVKTGELVPTSPSAAPSASPEEKP